VKYRTKRCKALSKASISDDTSKRASDVKLRLILIYENNTGHYNTL
jgi:hypothetical protein